MYKIETKEDLIAWSTEINRGISIARKCDMQDIYSRSQQMNIINLFIECKNERNLILCSVYNCMAYGEVECLLKALAHHYTHTIIEDSLKETNAKLKDISDREQVLEDSKKKIYEKIRDLEDTIRYFTERLDHFRTLYQQEVKKCSDYRKKSKKYDRIKSLLV